MMAWAHMKMLLTLTVCQMIYLGNSQEDPEASTAPEIPKPDVYELSVITNIQYRYATTVVSSRVVNPADVSQEVRFTVVLPETAFIAGFLMEIKGKVYNAYVKEKDEAKKTYDDAVSEGRGAAHIEQNARDSNQFTVSVNIEPQDKVNFNLTYEELLSRTLGTYNHVININPGQIVRDLSVVVTINETSNITKVEVPKLQVSNDVAPDNSSNPLATIDWKSSQLVTVRYAPTPEQQKEVTKDGINGQLTVKYDVDRGNSQQILVNEGYFVHFFAPETLQPLPKHVVFVLDYSGSMIGRKIEQLKEAISTILSDLSLQDYFSLVLFSNNAESWSPASENTTELTTTERTYMYYESPERPKQELGKDHIVPVTPANILSAKNHVNTYSDYGGTNIISGLRDGLRLTEIGSELLKNNAVPPEPMIIFLTDGQPNIEISDPEEIIKKVKELNTKKVSIFSLAFGYGADFKFLRKLSLSNNGFARNIYEAADAAIQLKNFYKEVASPLLSNIKFDYLPGQVDNTTSTQRRFPTFYYGSEIVVAGKLVPQENEETKNVEAGKLIARSIDGDTTFPIIIPRPWLPRPYPIPPPVADRPVGLLEKMWAYLTIQQLLDKIDTLNQEAEVNATKSKALDLALKYKFVTPLTSLVVVKPNETKAVDTEQVRPGSNGGGGGSGGYSNLLSSSFAAAPSFANTGGANAYKLYAMPQRRVIMPTLFIAPAPTTALTESDDILLPGPEDTEKVQVEDLSWLSNYTTSDNTSVTLPLDSGDTVFKIGRNESDIPYGTCQLPNTNKTGECRHLQYCALKVYQDNVSSFLPYRCDITDGYLGTCCPVP